MTTSSKKPTARKLAGDDDTPRLDALEQGLAAVSAKVETVETRVATLEAAPAPGGGPVTPPDAPPTPPAEGGPSEADLAAWQDMRQRYAATQPTLTIAQIDQNLNTYFGDIAAGRRDAQGNWLGTEPA